VGNDKRRGKELGAAGRKAKFGNMQNESLGHALIEARIPESE